MSYFLATISLISHFRRVLFVAVAAVYFDDWTDDQGNWNQLLAMLVPVSGPW
jgi:hypothetical protein